MTTRRLGEIATFINGRAFKPSEWSDSGMQIIRIQNLTNSESNFNYFKGDYDNKYLVKANDLLISWSATLDIFRWKGNPALLNQHIFKVVFDKCEVDQDYFYYAVKNELEYMRTQTHGSTMKHITKKPFENVQIYFPSIDLQKKIGLNLNKIDEIRAKNGTAQELSSAYPLALFNKMFNNPERKWQVKSLADACEFLDNLRKPVKESERKPGPYPYYGANGQVGTIDDYLFDEPLVLLAEDGGNWGDPSRHIAYEISGKSWVNNHAHVLRPEKGFDISFILYSIAYIDIQHLISGTTRGKLTKKAAESIPITCAPVELQKEFGKRITAFKKVRENQAKSTERLDSLFASLSNKYFNSVK
jgi:type I restriction enzyme S subunit